ncbi:MAG: serine/threonine protein kinase [Betaproteobacteria bacterium]|nr:serine/threonine protein kinase [Betaproteobacteria bacterium]
MGAQDPLRYRRLLDLLGEALDQPEDAREAWVETLGGDDAGLQADLRRLLSRQDDPALGAHIDGGAAAMLPEAGPSGFADAHWPGDAIGPYVLDSALGFGGMGTVWRAYEASNRALPAVAIKLPAVGPAARGTAERLQREGRILAALNHPGIARLIDTGVTADGAPYLVMECIEGEPLFAHCDRQRLDTPARLALFVKVLDAVAHAHASLILHRDLKPSNVMVNASGEVKLLDFGIAKLIGTTGTAHATELTRLAGRALTPDYASPEQVADAPLTVASDIYSLGVMLFELLTGERPYQLKRGSAAELEEAILAADTRRPSTAVGGAFAQRAHVPLARLKRQIAGDADTIILKALKKRPAERYATAAEFRDDLQRLIDGRPVLATPDSALYRARKFVARNRMAVGAAGAVLLALLGGLAAALWQAGVAREQAREAAAARAQAEQRFNDVRGIANALIFDVHGAIEYVPGATEARRKLTAKAVEFLDKVAAADSNDPAVLRELAEGYLKIAWAQYFPNAASLGDARGAGQSYDKAVALLRRAVALPGGTTAERAKLAEVLGSQGTHLRGLGQIGKATGVLQESLALREALWKAEPANAAFAFDVGVTQFYLANIRLDLNDPKGALAWYERAHATYQDLLARDPASARNRWALITYYENTGKVLLELGRVAEAKARIERAVELARALSADKPDHYSILTGFGSYSHLLGTIARRAGDAKAARMHFEDALRRRRQLVARDAGDAEAQFNLLPALAALAELDAQEARAASARARIAEAERIARALLAMQPDSLRFNAEAIRVSASRARLERLLRNAGAACRASTQAHEARTQLHKRFAEAAWLDGIGIPACKA